MGAEPEQGVHLGVGVTDVGLVVDTVEVLQVVLLVHVLLGLGRSVLGKGH